MGVPQTSERLRLMKLLDQKDQLEIRIKEQGRILRTNRVGMQDTLVDRDGFPRNDIDVHQVRNARHQIICLQNDLKALMLDIERGLHDVHALEPSASSAGTTTKMANLDLRSEAAQSGQWYTTTDAQSKKPFVRVESLQRGSPAEEAGLLINDEIVEFGTLNASNFNGVAQIADIVQHSVGKAIRLCVQRTDGRGRLDELSLVPGQWSGRGLLGCVIVPCGGRTAADR